ncbi:MAG: cation:proton antiporter [Betaproteobacteria bacterium]
MTLFAELLLLLAAAVIAVALCRRWHVPASLGYLAVGALLGPHALGWVASAEAIHGVAKFGLVFLLFAIGLNFSLPQIYALRHVWLGLGTGQVVLTTVALGAVGWALGLPPVAALVLGAAWAQSSTSLIGRQLEEQDEQHSRHGRLALAMSVFQDVTAVPIVVIVPVLGAAAVGVAVGVALALALAKALAAFAVVYLVGRRLLRPLFHAVAARRSAELFTLTVLLVALAAGALTEALGLSLAFGAFLAGMMLGDTEFRHQIEASIRPFRDVLLGLFFAAIGMLFEPRALPAVWPWALGAAVLLLVVKIVLVAGLVRVGGADRGTALRTALTLAVGGEFGFAVLALALTAGALEPAWAPAGLAAILASMVAGSLLIRYNGPLARALGGRAMRSAEPPPPVPPPPAAALRDHTIVCGYGRIGQNVARLVREEEGAYVALDLDALRVREAHAAGEPVYFGDATDLRLLEAVGLAQARLVVVAHDDADAALRLLRAVRPAYPQLPVMVRARDDERVEALRAAGATEVVAETVEAGLTLAAHALWLLHVPAARIARRLRTARGDRYRLLREVFRGDEAIGGDAIAERLHTVTLPPGVAAVGCRLEALALGGGRVVATALVRDGLRYDAPAPDTELAAGDTLVLFGLPDDLLRAEARLLAAAR